MALTFTWLAVPGLASGIFAAILAVIIYIARPRSWQNRTLALAMVLSAVTNPVWRGLAFMTADASIGYAAIVIGYVSVLMWEWAMFRFFATLDTPISAWLSRPGPKIATHLYLGSLVGAMLLDPSLFIRTIVALPVGSGFIGGGGPLSDVFIINFILFQILSIAIGVQLLRRAQTEAERRRARWYGAAFIVSDVAFLMATASIQVLRYVDTNPAVFMYLTVWIAAWAGYLFVVLGYAILRDQLFDVELKLRWGLERGTVATIFLAVFFVVAVTAENFLTTRFGWAFGGVAAGLLLFALAPLQRLGERLGHAAMPHVVDTAEYRTVRKREVYEIAYRTACTDGALTGRERDMLAALQDQLGLSATAARGIEKEVRQPSS